MTVSSSNLKLVYTGNGSTKNFPVTFPYNSDATYLSLYLTNELGVTSEISSDFSINTNTNVVTYPVAASAIPSTHKLTIIRETPKIQDTDFQNQGAFTPEQVERDFDKLVFILQELGEQVQRCIRYSVEQNPTDIDSSSFLEQINSARDLALSYRNDAISSASSAATSASNAATSEANINTAISSALVPVNSDIAQLQSDLSTLSTNTTNAINTVETNLNNTINNLDIGFVVFATESVASNAAISLNTKKMQLRRVQGSGGAITANTIPFGSSITTDGIIVRLVGMSDSNTIAINYNDADYGALLNGDVVLKKGNVLELYFDLGLLRWIECYRNF